MTTPAYQQYLNSPEWVARRTLYFSKHAKECFGCGTREAIDLHHHTYVRLGREQDSDLIPVCREHHFLIHQHHNRTGGSLTIATFEVLALLRDPVAAVDREIEFVPQRLRGAGIGEDGLTHTRGTWREEVREPGWIVQT